MTIVSGRRYLPALIPVIHLSPIHRHTGWNSASCWSMFSPCRTLILICKLVFNALLHISASYFLLSVKTWQRDFPAVSHILISCCTPFDLQHLAYRRTPFTLWCMLGTGYNRSRKRKEPEILKCASENRKCERGWILAMSPLKVKEKESTQSFWGGFRIVAFSVMT